jgi:mxaL protein
VNVLPSAWRRRRVAVPLASGLLLALALLLPDFTLTRPVAQVIVVLDVSQSMNTPDCQLDRAPAAVSRLACVKDALSDALRALPCGAKLAWGVFTGNQTFVLATPVEICTHRGELLQTLANLDWRITWDAGSRIGGALVSAMRVVPQVPHETDLVAGLVFITAGHGAPPVSPGNRRRFEDYAGKVQGVIVGVGGDALTPMPKYDMDGKYLGTWSPDDVPQMDMSGYRALSSVPGEKMAGEDDATPSGTEHLSSLKEDYLQLLAGDARLDYRRLCAARTCPGDAARRNCAGRAHRYQLRWIPALLAAICCF